ncbi:MAG: hypothetical protein AUI93_04795 [Crenarchaeota archaeon 13_1_40CM_3_52_10]|nr:MAG: hypothetical protein AUI93_04795 [Crenarchaeota archaeon 13_1_40CM_3_52_10]
MLVSLMALSLLGTTGLTIPHAYANNAVSNLWARTYGGTGGSNGFASFSSDNSAQQTSDGGFIVAGTSDIFGPGPQCRPDPCDQAWVFRLDKSGNVEWQFAYGGKADSGACCVQETHDNGFIVAGQTSVFGVGLQNVWVLKLDHLGNVEWQNAYGGAKAESVSSVQDTPDGGFIVAGDATSFGAGATDAWLLKLDENGNVQWQKTYGGTAIDHALSVGLTSDGGFIVAGTTNSFGAGFVDAWVFKVDESGNVQWQKTYGGPGIDHALSVGLTSDGGFIVAGTTNSFGAGFVDAWVFKVDESGNVQWQNTYGGTGEDFAASVQQTSDGGFIVAGTTSSFQGAPFGPLNGWIFKLSTTGSLEWSKTYGGSSYNPLYSVEETSDGGFVAAGVTNLGSVNGDARVLKLDETGNVEWQHTYGGASIDVANSVRETRDDGFVVAGATESFAAGQSDAWVLKLDEQGNIGACGIIGSPQATVMDTSALVTLTPTTVSGTDSTATVTSTQAIVTTTSAETLVQCSSHDTGHT